MWKVFAPLTQGEKLGLRRDYQSLGPQHEQRGRLGNDGHSRGLMESKAFSVSLFQMSGTPNPE